MSEQFKMLVKIDGKWEKYAIGNLHTLIAIQRLIESKVKNFRILRDL